MAGASEKDSTGEHVYRVKPDTLQGEWQIGTIKIHKYMKRALFGELRPDRMFLSGMEDRLRTAFFLYLMKCSVRK